MSPPKASYIVASYNHEAYIRELLESILNQTFPDFEAVVVDDGSSDGTLRIAQEVASTDARMTVYAQANHGIVNARNRGVLCSHGEYVSIVDSDDLLPLDRTRLQVDALDANSGAVLVYGDAWLIDRHGGRIRRYFEIYPPVKGDFSTEMFANYGFVPAISVMFRRPAFDKAGPFWGPDWSTDYLKWIELGMLGEVICLREKQLGCWRVHGKNTSRPPAGRHVEMYESLCGSLQTLASRCPELANRVGAARLRQRYANCHFLAAYYAGLGHLWGLSRSQAAKAFAYRPSLLHAAAWASALPVVNAITAPLYPLAARIRKLP
jgi:glycosyltransferase involved in cell wall biosynthesis